MDNSWMRSVWMLIFCLAILASAATAEAASGKKNLPENFELSYGMDYNTQQPADTKGDDCLSPFHAQTYQNMVDYHSEFVNEMVRMFPDSQLKLKINMVRDSQDKEIFTYYEFSLALDDQEQPIRIGEAKAVAVPTGRTLGPQFEATDSFPYFKLSDEPSQNQQACLAALNQLKEVFPTITESALKRAKQVMASVNTFKMIDSLPPQDQVVFMEQIMKSGSNVLKAALYPRILHRCDAGAVNSGFEAHSICHQVAIEMNNQGG